MGSAATATSREPSATPSRCPHYSSLQMGAPPSSQRSASDSVWSVPALQWRCQPESSPILCLSPKLMFATISIKQGLSESQPIPATPGTNSYHNLVIGLKPCRKWNISFKYYCGQSTLIVFCADLDMLGSPMIERIYMSVLPHLWNKACVL